MRIETLNEYQGAIEKFARYPGDASRLDETMTLPMGLIYTTLGLCGEAGEFSEKVKKALRDTDFIVTPEYIELMEKELGDVLWFVARCAKHLNIPLERVAQTNYNKLHDRLVRGTLRGHGDER